MNNSEDTGQNPARQTSEILSEVALNLRWSWNHATDQLWQRLDPSCGSLRTTPGLFCRRYHAKDCGAW